MKSRTTRNFGARHSAAADFAKVRHKPSATMTGAIRAFIVRLTSRIEISHDDVEYLACHLCVVCGHVDIRFGHGTIGASDRRQSRAAPPNQPALFGSGDARLE